jgi:hypothetical protein
VTSTPSICATGKKGTRGTQFSLREVNAKVFEREGKGGENRKSHRVATTSADLYVRKTSFFYFPLLPVGDSSILLFSLRAQEGVGVDGKIEEIYKETLGRGEEEIKLHIPISSTSLLV